MVDVAIVTRLPQPEATLCEATLLLRQQQPGGLHGPATEALRLLIEFQDERDGATPGLRDQRPIQRPVRCGPQDRPRRTIRTGLARNLGALLHGHQHAQAGSARNAAPCAERQQDGGNEGFFHSCLKVHSVGQCESPGDRQRPQCGEPREPLWNAPQEYIDDAKRGEGTEQASGCEPERMRDEVRTLPG